MLQVREIHKEYEGKPLLRGISLEAHEGETICLLGSSGSGKSTLLRIIAGLETPDSGSICWDSTDLTDVPPHRRNFGLMFQDYALFPHRNVAQNVAFGLRMQGLPTEEVNRLVHAALAQVNLEGFEHRRVTDLSGGEQQRVALARTLAPRPRLIMLDEPLAALDRALREQLLEELRGILRQTRIPAVYVTHDQQEAFALADRIVLLHEGNIVQSGAPDEVYARPASTWVANFLGLANLLTGSLRQVSPLEVETPVGIFRSADAPAVVSRSELTLLLRPSAARLLRPDDPPFNHLTARVEDAVFHGENFALRLCAANGQELRFTSPIPLPLGEEITLWIDPRDVLAIQK
jgi:ABC-type Fe3+/spermidine/putrescine transport system ATPase subunit